MDTREVQAALVALGYSLTVDGVAGPKTRTAVQAFQRGRGIAADGVVGPLTAAALRAAVAAKEEAPPAGATTVSDDGLIEIVSHEALVTSPYLDSVKVWTVGVGHTAAAGAPTPANMPKGVARPVTELLRLFRSDLVKYEREVLAAVKVPLKQHQLDALVSFHFNTGGIARAALTNALNKGDLAGAADGFMGWVKPAEMIGRRQKEQALFRDGTYSHDGKATIYPASASGAVQWRKGQRVDVLKLLKAA